MVTFARGNLSFVRFFMLSVLVTGTIGHAKELVSASVGRVSDHVLTTREVEANQRIERALYAKKDLEIPKLSQYQTKAYASLVNSILIEWVVFLEAKGFSATKVSEDDVEKAIQLLKTKLNSKEWQALEVSDAEWRGIVRRKLQAKAFMRFKASSSVVPVTEGVALQYYKKNNKRFAGRSFPSVKNKIYRQLGTQQIQRRLRDWFEVLQSKYKVRNLVAYK